jgi:PAS domain S-box-containing protein
VADPEGDVCEVEALLAALAGSATGRAEPDFSRSASFAARTSSSEKVRSSRPGLGAIYPILVEQIPAVIFVAFLGGGLPETYVSPQIEAALGFSQEEWLGDPVRWYRQIHPEDKSRWSAEAAGFFLTGKPLKSTYRVMARDGSIVWFQCEAKLVRHADGNPWFIHGVGFDVSELKRLQESELARQMSRTEETENLLQRLFDSMPEGLFLVDEAGRITKANRSAEAILGMPLSQMLGIEIRSLLGSSEIPSNPAALLQRAPDGRLYVETAIYPVSGCNASVGVSCTLVRNTRGEAAGLLLVVRDISERKQVEEKLRLTEKLAATGRLAASMAHEINNPLEAVVNLVFLAANQPGLPEKTRSYLQNADLELARVAHIARQTLGFYRDTTAPILVRPSEVLDEILALYSRKIEYKELKIETRYRRVEAIETLLGDLRQVLSNLIVNAIDASPPCGRILVRASPAWDWERHQQIGIRISIADTGPGIFPELRSRIFEPFFSTKKNVGTGLGLWITKSLVEKSGGRIQFRSRPEVGRRGTVFSIFIPSNPPSRA